MGALDVVFEVTIQKMYLARSILSTGRRCFDIVVFMPFANPSGSAILLVHLAKQRTFGRWHNVQ